MNGTTARERVTVSHPSHDNPYATPYGTSQQSSRGVSNAQTQPRQPQQWQQLQPQYPQQPQPQQWQPSQSQRVHDSAYMTSKEREELVFKRTESEYEDLQERIKRRRFNFKRRTKMPFKLKIAVFACVFAVALVFYCIMFATGNQLGASLNDWTDSVMCGFADWLFGFAGNVFHADWSEKAIPLQRLLTLGPVSYVLVAAAASFVVTGVLALAWSYIATNNALEDGTSNFRSEWRQKKDKQRKESVQDDGSMAVSSPDDIHMRFVPDARRDEGDMSGDMDDLGDIDDLSDVDDLGDIDDLAEIDPFEVSAPMSGVHVPASRMA